MKENGIINAQNITADCGAALPALIRKAKKELSGENAKLIVILDPPRKGCDKAVTDALIKTPADKIVYISCDPATLSRDIRLLTENGAYTLTYVRPYDMFPQTPNVETLCCLQHKD